MRLRWLFLLAAAAGLIAAGCNADVLLQFPGSDFPLPGQVPLVSPTPTAPPANEFAWVTVRAVVNNPQSPSNTVDVIWRHIDPQPGHTFSVLVDDVPFQTMVSGTNATLTFLPDAAAEVRVIRDDAGAPVDAEPSPAVVTLPFNRLTLPIFGLEPGVVVEPGTSECFGKSLVAGDFEGNAVMSLRVGAPYADPGTISNGGAVYRVNNNGAGALTLGTPIFPAALAANDHFGFSLAKTGYGSDGAEDFVVGAPAEAGSGEIWTYESNQFAPLSSGAIGAFHGASLYTYSFEQESDGEPDLFFGSPGELGMGKGNAHFIPNDNGDGGWKAVQPMGPIATPTPGTQLGTSVALAPNFTDNGGTITSYGLAGAPSAFNQTGRVLFMPAGNTDPYFITGSAGFAAGMLNSLYGAAIAAGGLDITADGDGDIAIGAPGGGYVDVLPGGTLSITNAVMTKRTISAPGGGGVATSLDFGRTLLVENLDGLLPVELVVGSPGFGDGVTNGQLDRGAVFIYRYNPVGSQFSQVWQAQGPAAQTFLGASFATEDFDGDGWRDLAVGATSCGLGGAPNGVHDSVHVYFAPPPFAPGIRGGDSLIWGERNVPVVITPAFGTLGAGGMALCEWDWGDSTVETPVDCAAASHTYTALGDYFVKLTVSTPYGLSSEIRIQVAIR